MVAALPTKGYGVTGIQNPEDGDFRATFYDPYLVHERVNLTVDDAFRMAQEAQRNGLPVGFSSGAALFAARKIARSMSEGTILVILPDDVKKYLSIFGTTK